MTTFIEINKTDFFFFQFRKSLLKIQYKVGRVLFTSSTLYFAAYKAEQEQQMFVFVISVSFPPVLGTWNTEQSEETVFRSSGSAFSLLTAPTPYCRPR